MSCGIVAARELHASLSARNRSYMRAAPIVWPASSFAYRHYCGRSLDRMARKRVARRLQWALRVCTSADGWQAAYRRFNARVYWYKRHTADM